MTKERKPLRLIEKNQDNSVEVASFFLAMSTMRGEMALAARSNILDIYGKDADGKISPKKRTIVTHHNLFDVTSDSLTLHQVLAKTENTFLDKEMRTIWEMFVSQDEGADMDEYSMASELTGWEFRRMVSGQSRVEFMLRAGTGVAYVGSPEKGFLVQDLVPVPKARDPFSINLMTESRSIREYSPLVVLPRKVNEKHWSVVSRLAANFIDTLAVLAEPISVRMVGQDTGYHAPFDVTQTYSLNRYLDEIENGKIDPRQKMFIPTPERRTYWADKGEMRVEATFMNKKVVSESGIKISPKGSFGFDVDGVTNAKFLRDVLMSTVESGFLPRLNETKRAAEAASLIFVEDLYRSNREELSQVDPEKVQLFAELIYGTWVTGLLSLWRRQVSNRVAKAIASY